MKQTITWRTRENRHRRHKYTRHTIQHENTITNNNIQTTNHIITLLTVNKRGFLFQILQVLRQRWRGRRRRRWRHRRCSRSRGGTPARRCLRCLGCGCCRLLRRLGCGSHGGFVGDLLVLAPSGCADHLPPALIMFFFQPGKCEEKEKETGETAGR